MRPDDPVCLCFKVSQRKLTAYMNRERPRVPSQLSECLGAGTGCHWCVPFLEELFHQWSRGHQPDLPVDPGEYEEQRRTYRRTGERGPVGTAGECGEHTADGARAGGDKRAEDDGGRPAH